MHILSHLLQGAMRVNSVPIVTIPATAQTEARATPSPARVCVSMVTWDQLVVRPVHKVAMVTTVLSHVTV